VFISGLKCLVCFGLFVWFENLSSLQKEKPDPLSCFQKRVDGGGGGGGGGGTAKGPEVEFC